MLNITARSANELYQVLCRELYEGFEYESKPRDMEVRECVNVSMELINPRNNLITLAARDLSMRYLAGEFAFYFAGSDRLDFISTYSKFWNKCSDNKRTVNSCYGKTLMFDKNGPNNLTNFQYAAQCLMKDKDSRKAVMTIYRPDRNNYLYSRDNPCTMYLQFMIRDHRLNLHVYMRSNDVWTGLPYDIPFFTLVQQKMLICLLDEYPNLQLGSYFHNVGSMHCYEKNYEQIKVLLNSGGELSNINPLGQYTKETFIYMDNFLYAEEQYREFKEKSTITEHLFGGDLLLRQMYSYITGEPYENNTEKTNGDLSLAPKIK